MSWVNKEDFEVGETYQMSGESSPFTLLDAKYSALHWDGNYKSCLLVKYATGRYCTPFNKTRLWKKKGTTMDKQLYTMLNRDNVGEKATLVGKKLSGFLVMELTNSEDIVTVPSYSVEKVVPYTVGVKFANTPYKTYQYLATEGDWKEGDLFLVKGDIGSVAQVMEIDTRSPKANVKLTGIKIEGKMVGESESS